MTQSNIEDLLSGSGEVVYSITLSGNAQTAYTMVEQLPWVCGIETSYDGDQIMWDVCVTDETAAKDQLMGMLVSNGLRVSNFSRKEQKLEDVFINIVERSQK
jgi:ABC-type uncharacterized transport system ATPase subunit